jgi:hypothetical protein
MNLKKKPARKNKFDKLIIFAVFVVLTSFFVEPAQATVVCKKQADNTIYCLDTETGKLHIIRTSLNNPKPTPAPIKFECKILDKESLLCLNPVDDKEWEISPLFFIFNTPKVIA